MKKIIFLSVFVLILNHSGFSQTKKIFHRSHSGKNNSFTISAEGNFGNPRRAPLDTTLFRAKIVSTDSSVILPENKKDSQGKKKPVKKNSLPVSGIKKK